MIALVHLEENGTTSIGVVVPVPRTPASKVGLRGPPSTTSTGQTIEPTEQLTLVESRTGRLPSHFRDQTIHPSFCGRLASEN